MKSKKGLTLVEIIVAIALLGVVSLLMFPALTNQYIMLRNTRSITIDLYEAQQEIEKTIIDIRRDIQAGINPDGQTKQAYTLFRGQPAERVVDGYPTAISLHVDNSSLTLNTVVADSRMPEFDVATASNVRLRFYNGSSYLDNAYTLTPSLRLVSSFDLYDPGNVNLTNISRWYVSRRGFNSPMITNPQEIENGSVYPRYPEDYVIIPNINTTSMTSIQESYAGRHIVYAVTPASQSGKMGVTSPSNPVFISGLPVISNLILHLDASMLSRESSTVSDVYGHYYVNQWNDISGNNNHAAQSDTSRRPELLSFRTGLIVDGGMTYETYAKYLKFSGDDGMTVSHKSALNDNLTIFAVMRSANTTADKTILRKVGSSYSTSNGWSLGWIADNQLGLNVFRGSASDTVSADPGTALDNEWHILTATSGLSFQVDSLTPLTVTRTAGSLSNSSALTIGYSDSNYTAMDIAEIIIYNGILSEEEQYKVNMYLKDKYDPDSPNVYIYALKPITDSAVIGEPYTLPNIIRAYMTNGTMMDVPVTWSVNPIDTTSAGIKTSVATAISNPSKTTTATIDVAGISYLNDMTVTVMQNDPYTLPASVVATLTSGKTRNTAVTWNIDTVNTSTIGTQSRVGTSVIDVTKSMTLTIDVVPRSVTGVELNASSISINSNDTFQLIADVKPDDAYNKNVSWISSDESVVLVSSSGEITGVGSGQATITVTTQDGGYVATCDVTVTTSVTGVTLNITAITRPRGSVIDNLVATVLPENASNKDVSWSSSNTNVARVDQNGVVTVQNYYNNGWRPSNGSTATITVQTADGDHTATCVLTVGRQVTGVSLASSLTVSVGQTRSLTATVAPDDAQNKTVFWQTDNPNIATVSSNGQVQGVAIGQTTITVTTEDGGYTDQCTVTVVQLAVIRLDEFTSGWGWIDGNRFKLVFNKPIQSATAGSSLTNAAVAISGSEVTISRSNGNFNTGTHNVTVQSTDGDVLTVTVELTQSWWSGYDWSLR